jgi:hypothetical protein
VDTFDLYKRYVELVQDLTPKLGDPDA